MDIEFSKIKKSQIFNDDFDPFLKNNKINFKHRDGIAVIYAPNGVGKSSLSKVLSSEANTEMSVVYDGVRYTSTDCDIFHVISDQNARNIIKGELQEFLLGDNIAKEYELKRKLDVSFADIFTNMKDIFKNLHKIAKQTDEKIAWLPDYTAGLVRKIAKSGSSFKDVEIGLYLDVINELSAEDIKEHSPEKMDFLRSSGVIINTILGIGDIPHEKSFGRIEENSDAIGILKKYAHKQDCVVCDNSIDTSLLIGKKQEDRDSTIRGLSTEAKAILDSVISRVDYRSDPFEIRQILIHALSDDDASLLEALQEELASYKTIFAQLVVEDLRESMVSGLAESYAEYQEMISSPLGFTGEDIRLIEMFIEKSLDRKLSLERRDNGTIALHLDSNEFLNVSRDELGLSAGEQNFISMAFELLKAQHVSSPVIVIDDPISSFDSIYKNKLVYAIVKFLERKKVILLTHNPEVLRLVDVQHGKGFNLFLLGNAAGQENGFVPVGEREKGMLVYVTKLLDLLRSSSTEPYVVDSKLFVYSLIPFMRGYAQFIGDGDLKNSLTNLMHGYLDSPVDLSSVYNEIFDKNISLGGDISVANILGLDIDNIDEILNKEEYPLFNRVLINNLTYLYLRMKTEKTLVSKYGIDTNKYCQLSDIIHKSFNLSTDEHLAYRLRLFSKKSLLNEFNHFDGNMNIFQPAIDISETTLKREYDEIIDILSEISGS